MNTRNARIGLAVLLTLMVLGGIGVLQSQLGIAKNRVVAYFDNSNGLFKGDEVRILGVKVGEIERIEPQPQRAKITFWFAHKYQVPADVTAAILSPSLVTARAVQLTPAYTGGPTLTNNAVIPQDRTAVPVEWDDFRDQLETITESLQPTEPGGVSTLGALINTSAANLRGEGVNIRDTVMKLSQAFSALGDHSTDIFSTVKNMSVLVSALQSSTELMQQLNGNFAAVTALLANSPNEVERAVTDLNTAVADARNFVADNRESLGTTSDNLASISNAVMDSLYDIKQVLHVAPTAFSNFINVYEPAHSSLTGALAVNNFSNPITFICSAIQAASRLSNEQSAKLCVQYLAPIVKNRQWNFPPLGLNALVNAQARPNEVTYSEDWLRPDYAPPPAPADTPAPPPGALPAEQMPAQQSVATDPGAGLPGLMMPQGVQP
jgi:phospholipid/cholesterol/gamma-HCH transport system substrate-binding protein